MSTTSEFSRLIAIEGIIPDRLRKEDVTATAEECAALAKRFDLRVLSDFDAKLSIQRLSEGKMLRITGEIEAEVIQACVVSLRDVPAHVHATFDAYFSEDGKSMEDDIAIDSDEEMEDVIQNGMLDLGELAAQYLSLELNPYPRAPGVSLAAQVAENGAASTHKPFQVLQGIKKDTKD